MTRLPTESWNIKPRLDLPPYELNKACPVTGEVTGLEDHHLFRRSFTALGKEDNDRLFWVELEDGTVIGNRINLSASAHYRVTVNKARIVYRDGLFEWVEDGTETALRWQPPKWDWLAEEARWAEQNRKLDGISLIDNAIEAVLKDDVHVEPGHDCPTCKRRIPIPKKKTSPTTKVFSTRVPIDDAETFAELVDAAAEHAGLKSKPHHVYNTLLVGLTLVLQSPKEHLP